MGQASGKACKGGGEIAKDNFREYVLVLIEAYDIAAYPPALSYGPAGNMQEEPKIYDLLKQSRRNLLDTGIDAKYALKRTLDSLPKNRADVLRTWIKDGSNYYKYSLSHKKRLFLKIDRLALKQAMKGDQ